MALDDHKDTKGKGPQKGVWKSGKGKGRHHTKGRQLQDGPWEEVRALLGDRPRNRDPGEPDRIADQCDFDKALGDDRLFGRQGAQPDQRGEAKQRQVKSGAEIFGII